MIFCEHLLSPQRHPFDILPPSSRFSPYNKQTRLKWQRLTFCTVLFSSTVEWTKPRKTHCGWEHFSWKSHIQSSKAQMSKLSKRLRHKWGLDLRKRIIFRRKKPTRIQVNQSRSIEYRLKYRRYCEENSTCGPHNAEDNKIPNPRVGPWTDQASDIPCTDAWMTLELAELSQVIGPRFKIHFMDLFYGDQLLNLWLIFTHCHFTRLSVVSWCWNMNKVGSSRMFCHHQGEH